MKLKLSKPAAPKLPEDRTGRFVLESKDLKGQLRLRIKDTRGDWMVDVNAYGKLHIMRSGSLGSSAIQVNPVVSNVIEVASRDPF